MIEARLLSVQVGVPRRLGVEGAENPMDRTWTSGIFKEPVSGPVRLGRTNLDGDGQADLVHHGGADKAVLAYSADHYPEWRRALDQPILSFGAFGENLTIAGLSEAGVCIGDIWKIQDEVVVEVSQPRQPCWKLARRWRILSLALQVQESGRTGWYFRVVNEGIVGAGMALTLVERPYPNWTVARANEVMHRDRNDLAAVAELAALPALAANWKATLLRRVEAKIQPDATRRLLGENQ